MNIKRKLEFAGLLTKKEKLVATLYKPELLDFFENGSKLYLKKTSGSGRFTKIIDNKETRDIIKLCETLEYTLVYNNDAPRGGQLGDYVKLKRKNKFIIPKLEELNLL